MAFELSPITDDIEPDDSDNGNATEDDLASSPFDPHDLEDALTPDGTDHPDDIGQVTAAEAVGTSDTDTDKKT